MVSDHIYSKGVGIPDDGPSRWKLSIQKNGSVQNLSDCRLRNCSFAALNKSDFRIDRAGKVFDDMRFVAHNVDATAESSMPCGQFVDGCMDKSLAWSFYILPRFPLGRCLPSTTSDTASCGPSRVWRSHSRVRLYFVPKGLAW